MTQIEVIGGVTCIILSVFLVIVVLLQSGRRADISGTISGGAETFFGKNMGRSIDGLLGKLTIIVTVIFVLVVLFLGVAQLYGW